MIGSPGSADNLRGKLDDCLTEKSDSNIKRLVLELANRLHLVDQSLVMDSALDLVMALAIKSNDDLLHSAVAYNLKGMYTIFATANSDMITWGPEEVNGSTFFTNESTVAQPVLIDMLRRAIAECEHLSISGPPLQFRLAILRHLTLVRHLKHPALASYASRFVYDVQRYIKGLAEAYHANRSARKRTPHSEIAALDPANFHHVYHDVTRHLVFCLASVDPGKVSSDWANEEHGVYHDFVVIQKLFYYMVSLYAEHNSLFPKTAMAMTTSHVRAFGVVVKDCLDKFVAWRSAQPFLSPKDKRNNKADAASIDYLQRCLAVTYSSTQAMVAQLKRLGAEATFGRSKVGAAVAALEKASDHIGKVALDHNLQYPPTENTPLSVEILPEPDKIEGFHEQKEPHDDGQSRKRTRQTLDSTIQEGKQEGLRIDKPCDSLQSSDGSFGATGDWEDDCSVSSLTLDLPR